ncbi:MULTISPECIES: 2-dehydropantoate 2-reductase [unclassified Staphylococcus]|uniref:ketopantoate reductase family protein n=1 Tax=unclassified Staphylococcus TaxID=91994 RepID=UPI0021D1C6C4|nr:MULTISPECIES: 2-dehydropantoate 2-reductase [unclassified Staphylococcus]UXR69519.1 2-dehydropantoate 2-reductase [Staphylococcus sp. IVB6246]UXR71574.1 2-dehydropantoate 2-reductase [Staphylococcus sp. IVB6240]UXR73853.1 2-dehydropantoate 2-reductase [Staphylococcus sp. IVB6238]UXR76170.1 2-dehydropantoate 2-reductase [Staphylococcus sp. IVB6233]UXR80367.1 2-dehydropantoate 2-reductase [Staphylococcus sp. IVB6218]
MTKIAIAGAGAMGSRIGSYIKRAGYDVTLIDTWPDHVQAINEKGLEIQTETDTYTVDIPAVLPTDVTDTFDLIVILTKSMQSEEMIHQLKDKGAIHQDTAILTMMNGLGHDERFAKIVPHEQVFLAVTMWTAGMRGPGQILLEGQGSIELQRADGQADERTESINKIFNDAGLNAKISDNVFQSIWSKATLNSVLNPLCSILNKTIYEFGSYENARDMVIPVIDEIVAVAKARGIELDGNALLEKIEAAYPKETQGLHYPSMHQDLYNGRYTEVDYLNGQISKYGREANIPTPNNDMLTHLIHQLEMTYVK